MSSYSVIVFLGKLEGILVKPCLEQSTMAPSLAQWHLSGQVKSAQTVDDFSPTRTEINTIITQDFILNYSWSCIFFHVSENMARIKKAHGKAKKISIFQIITLISRKNFTCSLFEWDEQTEKRYYLQEETGRRGRQWAPVWLLSSPFCSSSPSCWTTNWVTAAATTSTAQWAILDKKKRYKKFWA